MSKPTRYHPLLVSLHWLLALLILFMTAPLAAGLVLKAEYDLNREPRLELKNNVFRAQIAARF